MPSTEPFTNVDVFMRARLADSAGHVRRLAAQGALFVDGCTITKPDDVFASEVPDGISDWVCLGVGSRQRWVQVYTLNQPEPMMWDEP
jgi:hypothetical protein